MDNKFLLTMATLAGVAAGSISTAALTGYAAVPADYTSRVVVKLGQQAKTTVENYLSSNVCPQTGVQDCDPSTDFSQVCMDWRHPDAVGGLLLVADVSIPSSLVIRGTPE